MPLFWLLKMLLMFVYPLPIRTDRTLRAVPYATYTLLFLNILIHLMTLRNSEYQMHLLHSHWGVTPTEPAILPLFTHGFLHADWAHLLGNMLVLWIVGTVLEVGIGSMLFLLLYFAGMVMAVLLNGFIGKVFQPEALSLYMVGASGAISGVTGFAAFRFFHTRVMTFPVVAIPIPLPVWLPLWGYAVYFGGREVMLGIGALADATIGGVAHWAHVGGLLLGVFAALLVRTAREGKREHVLEKVVQSTSPGPARPGVVLEGKSVQDLERMLADNPDDPELLEAAAALWVMDGDAEQARDIYLRAIPRFLAAGMTDRAAVSYLNVLRASPDTVLAVREQMALAAALERLGHHGEALQAYDLVLRHYPAYDDAPTALLRAAQIHHRHLKEPTRAAALLHALLANYPDSAMCNLARARLREVTGKR